MTWKTLLVHLELGRPNAGLLQIAGDLCERFDAAAIGIAACPPTPMSYGDVYVPGDVFACDRNEIAAEIGSAEAEFRSALTARSRILEWRAAEVFADVAEYVSRQARCADLIVTGVAHGDRFDSSRALGTGSLIMQAGRPVLLVPGEARAPKLERVMLAWKDTREARRAASDALPLMRRAADVMVVEIADAGQMDDARRHLDDLVAWLKRHAIDARAIALPSVGDDAGALRNIADRENCDVVVAGAYGHSRMREWMLGGVTRDLLSSPTRCALITH